MSSSISRSVSVSFKAKPAIWIAAVIFGKGGVAMAVRVLPMPPMQWTVRLPLMTRAMSRTVMTPSSSTSPRWRLEDCATRDDAKPQAKITKSALDRALIELQVTLNIVRSNAPELKNDTWLPFSEAARE